MNGSAQALDLRAFHNIAAPDILLIECRNAFLDKVRRQIISRDQAIQQESEFGISEVAIFSSLLFLSDAFRMALDLGGALYDYVYLASAVATDRILVTADERFSTKVGAAGFATDRVRLLAELPSSLLKPAASSEPGG
jgi:predicted nucleic acid-binding protein